MRGWFICCMVNMNSSLLEDAIGLLKTKVIVLSSSEKTYLTKPLLLLLPLNYCCCFFLSFYTRYFTYSNPWAIDCLFNCLCLFILLPAALLMYYFELRCNSLLLPYWLILYSSKCTALCTIILWQCHIHVCGLCWLLPDCCCCMCVVF